MKKEIKIAGAGPAGLTAAINLAKAGYKVKVYERNSDVGFKSNGDFQGLENWTKDDDILKSLRRMNIKPTFKHTPMKKFEFYDYQSNKNSFKSKKPFFYIIRRGNTKDCFDYDLKKQAIKAGAKIIFKKKLPETKADIIATGAKRHIVIAEGIKFQTDIPNQIIAIADDRLSPNFYSYLIVIDKNACILTCVSDKYFGDAKKLRDKTIERFQKLKKFKIKNPEAIGCGINYLIQETAIKNKRLYVGEAAGFQDALFGFGIRYAITSGYLAAKSIIEHKNYDELWKEEFGAIHKQGISNRLRFEMADNAKYATLVAEGSKGDGRNIFKKWYRPSIFKALLLPFAKALYKDRKIFK